VFNITDTAKSGFGRECLDISCS